MSFPETLKVEGQQNQLFPVCSVIKCFVMYLLTENYKKTVQKLFF